MTATSTDLLDRYLHAVKLWLPKAQQLDIVAELAEDLRSQVEEREASLGRPLGEDELALILKRRGSPLRVAAGYLPEQRLIHPAMVPVYRLVLWIVLLCVLAPICITVFIGPFFHSEHPARVLFLFAVEAWRSGFMTVGIVTVVFALFDRYHARFQVRDRWDPRKLPRVPVAHPATSRSNYLAGAIFGAVAAVFWVCLLSQRGEFAFPAGCSVILGPVWQYLYWPGLGLTVAGATLDLFSFLNPGWTRVRSSVRIALDAAKLLLVAAVFQAAVWVQFTAPALPAAQLAQVMVWINGTIRVTLLAIAVIALGDAIWEIRRLLRARPTGSAPALTVSAGGV